MLLLTDLANSLQPVKGRTDGSRFAPAFALFAPRGMLFKLENRRTWRSHRLDFGHGMNPSSNHYDDSPDGAWRTPMLSSPRVPWGFFIHCCWDSPAPPRPPRPDEASPAAAPPPQRPGPSSLPDLRNSTQPGPSPQRNQRFASKNVLVHETLPAIALMTVASLEITHISESPLAIIANRPWRQTTDGDSLQGIPLLLCV